MTSFSAVIDACVLYSSMLRNLFMHLSVTELCRLKWTAEIHTEWMRNVHKNHKDIPFENLERIRDLMDAHAGDALVTGYQHYIPSITLPSRSDAHVLAAAIHSKSSVIVTFNLKDFPLEETEKFGIEAQHPDEFIRHLLDLSAPMVIDALREMRSNLNNPPYSPTEFMSRLRALGLVESVRFLEPYCNGI